MADNFAFTEGSGKTGAADDIGGVLYPRVKIAQGADGSATDVSSAAPLQVSLANHGANATAVTVDGSGVTQPVSAASLPLPSGASTAAKQPALGTAGTASADVITVQGIASMTALKTDGSGVTQPVSGTVTANLAAGTNNIGDVDVLTVPADPFGANADAASATGSISAKLRFIASTGIPVTGTVTVGSHAVTNAGTFAVQAASAGDVAHDAADSGNPVKIGGKAVSAEPTAVTANDRANLITDLVGKIITLPYANPEQFITGSTAAITGTTSTSVIAAQGAGVRAYVTTIIVTNSHATVGTLVTITDGSAGATLALGYAAAAGGGFVLTLPTPIKTTANTALHAVCGTTGSNVYVTAIGYKGV